MTDQTDTPFGCPKTWREPVHYENMGVHYDNEGVHVCYRLDGHSGRHQCECGRWVARPGEDGDR